MSPAVFAYAGQGRASVRTIIIDSVVCNRRNIPSIPPGIIASGVEDQVWISQTFSRTGEAAVPTEPTQATGKLEQAELASGAYQGRRATWMAGGQWRVCEADKGEVVAG